MSEIKKQETDIETTKGFIEDRIRIINKLEEQLAEKQAFIEEQRIVLTGYHRRLQQQNEHLEQLKAKTVDTALGKYDFKCEACNKIHHQSAYCIAQRSLGNVMIHTCDCGNKTSLEPYEK